MRLSDGLLRILLSMFDKSKSDRTEGLSAIILFCKTKDRNQLMSLASTSGAKDKYIELIKQFLDKFSQEDIIDFNAISQKEIENQLKTIAEVSYSVGYAERAIDVEDLEKKIANLEEALKNSAHLTFNTSTMASCYWCNSPVRTIAMPTGIRGNAFGCCKTCQVLTCGHHAQRDNSAKVFACWDCDVRILLKSAQNITQKSQPLPTEHEQLFANDRHHEVTLEQAELFNSYDDFRERRTGYTGWFDQIEQLSNLKSWDNSQLEIALNAIPDDAKLLLIAAAFILAKIDIEGAQDSFLPFYFKKLTWEIKRVHNRQ